MGGYRGEIQKLKDGIPKPEHYLVKDSDSESDRKYKGIELENTGKGGDFELTSISKK